MKKDKLIIKSDVEFKVKEDIELALSNEIKKVIDEMSAKFSRNIKVEIKVDVE